MWTNMVQTKSSLCFITVCADSIKGPISKYLSFIGTDLIARYHYNLWIH